MADQNITELPIKTNSGVASTDYMLGIDSAEGYQILVRDVAKYIVENYNGSTIAGSAQTPKSAIDTLNSKSAWVFNTTSTIIAQAESLPNLKTMYFGTVAGYGNQSTLDSPDNTNAYVEVYKWNNNYITIRWFSINSGLSGNVYTRTKNGSTWDAWTKQPTRAEITELNSKLVYHSYAKSIAPLNITLEAESAYLLVIARYGGNGLDGSGMTAIVATAANGKADRIFSLASSNDYSVTVADKVLTIANTSTSTNMYALINVLKLN